MRPTRVYLPTLTTGGYSTPIVHDTWQTPNCITLAITWSSGITAGPIAAVQYSVDDVSSSAARGVTLAQSGSGTLTVTNDYGVAPASGFVSGLAVNTTTGDGGNHGFVVGDMVFVQGTPGAINDGWWNVASVVSGSSYTLAVTNSATYTVAGTIIGARMFTHSQLVNIAANTKAVSNYAFPVTLSRLAMTTGGQIGVCVLSCLQGGTPS